MQAWPHPTIPVFDGPADGRLRLTDTASGTLRDATQTAKPARMYVCGITPYDATHLGHAFTYLTFDLVNRVWRDLGATVVYTQNITDVDDPLLERAAQTGVDWSVLATSQIDLFRSDMQALRIVPPDHYLGVVESLDLVIDVMERLVAAGAIYQVDDPLYPDWYFAATAQSGFGDLSGLDRGAMTTLFADRGGDPGRPGKRDPLDPLVWRLARPGEPTWDSALGAGRPGWHVECTAIALDTLGPDFDVQGGGTDLIFPHHEMCAAQTRALTGRPMARTHVHVGMVGLEGEKMSKSKGNLVLVSQLLARGADPMSIRLALLAHHYRTPWSWTAADLAGAEVRLGRWRAAAMGGGAADPEPVMTRIRAAVQDDLHSERALIAVDHWAAASLASGAVDRGAAAAVGRVVDALLGVDVLGVAPAA